MTAVSAASADTKAILLLTAPLSLGGRSGSIQEAKPLTPSEYRSFAAAVLAAGMRPADLLDAVGLARVGGFEATIERDRVAALLGRGFRLAQAIDRWASRSIWVISRADERYPDRLKKRLREAAPPVLYGCGDPALLSSGGLAVVGSRSASAEALQFTDRVAGLAAAAGLPIISGGAKGVDRTAMCGALSRAGQAIGVLADQLERAVLERAFMSGIEEGRLVLISPFDPSAPFLVGHAMDRNKLVYALADAALVACADLRKGGTWAGAEEQLRRRRSVPVYVAAGCTARAVVDAMRAMGSADWPEPGSPEELRGIVLAHPAPPHADAAVVPSSLFPPHGPAAQSADVVVPKADAAPADELLDAVERAVVRVLDQPKSAAAIAKELRVTTPQATAWLKVLVDRGIVSAAGSRSRKYQRKPEGLFPS